MPTGCEDFPDEAAVRIRAANAAAPRPQSMASLPTAAPTAAAAAAAAAMSEGVPPPGSVARGGVDAVAGERVSAVASTHGHHTVDIPSSTVVRSVDLASTGSSSGQLSSNHRDGGEGPLGIFSPRPNRQRPSQLPAVLPEDGVSATSEGIDHDELVARQFFEATTGGSIESPKAAPLSERPQTVDLSGPDVWAGGPVAAGAGHQKPGPLNRLKRSASISVV